MKFIFLTNLFLSSLSNAKLPIDAKKYLCTDDLKNAPLLASTPSLLHQTLQGPVLALCGVAEASLKKNTSAVYKNFKLFYYGKNFEISKAIFENADQDKKFIALEIKNGLVLIESYQDKNLDLELFKHTISCTTEACKVEKEICIYPKSKSAQLKDKIKNKEIMKRLKTLGCLKK